MTKLAPVSPLLLQEFENVLCQDFENMNLEQLIVAEKAFCGLAGMRDHRETIEPNESQRESRDFLWFRLEQEKHKDSALKIGDIFYTHWGYDQTNTEFFKCVGFTKSGKSAIVRAIGLKSVEGSGGFMCDSVTPDPENELMKQEHDGQKFVSTGERLPDLRVKMTRGSMFNPRTHKNEEIREPYLRGSVYYGVSESKHLQNLYKYDSGKKGTYRSWYA